MAVRGPQAHWDKAEAWPHKDLRIFRPRVVQDL
jgi:hypothetical protein